MGQSRKFFSENWSKTGQNPTGIWGSEGLEQGQVKDSEAKCLRHKAEQLTGKMPAPRKIRPKSNQNPTKTDQTPSKADRNRTEIRPKSDLNSGIGPGSFEDGRRCAAGI